MCTLSHPKTRRPHTTTKKSTYYFITPSSKRSLPVKGKEKLSVKKKKRKKDTQEHSIERESLMMNDKMLSTLVFLMINGHIVTKPRDLE